MKKERGTMKFGGWLAGVAAAVVSGYVLWFLTQPKPKPPPPPPPAVTTFEGMVYSGDSPVAKAMVAVSLTGNLGANGPIHDITNAKGSYRIELTGLPKGTGATLSASATGYQKGQPKRLSGPLQTDVRIDLPLKPMVTKVVPPTAAEPLHPAITHIPVYVPKSAALAMKFHILTKKQP